MAFSWPVTTLFVVLYTVSLFALHQWFARRLLSINPWISCLFGFISIIMAHIFVNTLYFLGSTIMSIFIIIFIDIYRWSYISSQLNNEISRKNTFVQFVYKHKDFCNVIIYILFICMMLYDIIFIGVSSEPYSNYYPFFNLLCGIILILTLIIPMTESWSISQYNSYNKQYSDLVVTTDILWILLFSSFNLNFMFYSYFEFVLESVSLIFASILCIAFTKRTDLWFSSRFYTLSINAWIRCITANNFHYLINNGTSDRYKYIIFSNIWSVFNFVAGLLYTVYLMMFMWIQRKKYLRSSRDNKGVPILSDIEDDTNDEEEGEEEESDDLSTDNESSTSGGINDNEQSEANFDKSDDYD